MGFFNRSKESPRAKKSPPAEIVLKRGRFRWYQPPTPALTVSPSPKRQKKTGTRSSSRGRKATSSVTPDKQRQHRERLLNISHKLLEESLVGGSRQSETTATETEVTHSQLGFPLKEGAAKALAMAAEANPSDPGRSSFAELMDPSACSVLDLFSGLHLCGAGTVAGFAIQTAEEVQLLDDDSESSQGVAIPRVVTFTKPAEEGTCEESDHVLLSEVNEVMSMARRPSLLQRLRNGKRETALPRMRVYVDKPKRVPKSRSVISADFSVLTGPTVP